MSSSRKERSQDAFCDDKPKRKRRSKARRNVVQDLYGKPMKTEAIITKTVHDPMNKLSKKELERIECDVYDGMNPVVPYSMDKHKRWETTPMDFLENTKTRDAKVLVLERRCTYKCTFYFRRNAETNIRSAYYCDPSGGLVHKTARCMGTTMRNLVIDHKTHEKSKDCECCRSWNEDPRVEYRIIEPHENQWICTGNITGYGAEKHWVQPVIGRCHTKREYWEQVWEMSSDEEDWDDDWSDEEYTNQKDRKLCLGDFIVDKPINMKEWVIV